MDVARLACFKCKSKKIRCHREYSRECMLWGRVRVVCISRWIAYGPRWITWKSRWIIGGPRWIAGLFCHADIAGKGERCFTFITLAGSRGTFLAVFYRALFQQIKRSDRGILSMSFTKLRSG